MTSETRTFFQLSDIERMEVECPECKITVSYPIAVESIKRIGPGCPHCHYQFFDMATSTVAGREAYPGMSCLDAIIGNLSQFTRRDRTDIHANIRFRLNMETKAKP